MTRANVIDVSELPDYSISTAAPLWWGQALMAAIEASMFLMMIAIYFYIRLSVDMWPLPGTQLPHVTIPSFGLLFLFVSCGGSYWASEGAKKDDRAQMLSGLVFNVACGGAFLGLRAWEWHNFNFGWATDIHGSIVWAILYLHTLDAVADLFYTVVLIIIIAINRHGPKQRLGVHVDSVLWYFIAAMWVPFYVVVYWGPRLVGAPR